MVTRCRNAKPPLRTTFRARTSIQVMLLLCLQIASGQIFTSTQNTVQHVSLCSLVDANMEPSGQTYRVYKTVTK